MRKRGRQEARDREFQGRARLGEHPLPSAIGSRLSVKGAHSAVQRRRGAVARSTRECKGDDKSAPTKGMEKLAPEEHGNGITSLDLRGWAHNKTVSEELCCAFCLQNREEGFEGGGRGN